MSSITRILPKLKTSLKEKTDNDFENIKQIFDYYIDNANWKDYEKYRRLANNEVREEDYKSILYQYTNKNLKNFRGDIKSIPLIKPLLSLLTGEKRKAPFNYYVKVSNADANNKYLDGLMQQMTARNSQAFVNGLNEKGYDTGVPSKDVPEPEAIESQYKRTYKDARAVAGEELLEYAKDVLDVQEVLHQSYKKDWIVTGSAYIFPDIYKDEVEFTIERPENVYVEYSDKSPYASDGQVVVRRMVWTLADVISRFNLQLKDLKLDKQNAFDWLVNLISERQNFNTKPRYVKVINGENLTQEEYLNSVGKNYYSAYTTGEITLYYVAAKLLKKYNILNYINEMGQVLQMDVSDDYVLNSQHQFTKEQWSGMTAELKQQFIINNLGKDLYLEECYTNEVWHGYKIPGDDAFRRTTKNEKSFQSDSNSLYLNIEPHLVQRHQLNNDANCKLPVIGRNDGVNIPKELQEFQYKYNLIYLMEERALAKDKGQPILFPIDLIPDIPQWGNTPSERLEHMMYYSDVFNVIFFNGSDDRVNVLAQTLKSVDMSTIKTIAQFIELKAQIKADAWDAIGMNRNRWGGTFASEGKGKNEQDIFRSSLHTADLNSTFNKLEEELLLTYLDFSKIAYVNGKVITKYPKLDSYILSDESRAIYELDAEQHIESCYNVSVQPSDEEQDKLTAIQSILMPYAQNGIAPEAVIGAMATKNPHKAMDYLRKAEQIKQEREKAAQESQQQAQQQMVEMQQKTEKEKQDLLKELEYAKLQNDMLIAQLQEETKRIKIGTEEQANGETDTLTLKSRALDIQETKNNKDYELRNRDLNLKKELENKKIEVSKKRTIK